MNTYRTSQLVAALQSAGHLTHLTTSTVQVPDELSSLSPDQITAFTARVAEAGYDVVVLTAAEQRAENAVRANASVHAGQYTDLGLR